MSFALFCFLIRLWVTPTAVLGYLFYAWQYWNLMLSLAVVAHLPVQIQHVNYFFLFPNFLPYLVTSNSHSGQTTLSPVQHNPLHMHELSDAHDWLALIRDSGERGNETPFPQNTGQFCSLKLLPMDGRGITWNWTCDLPLYTQLFFSYMIQVIWFSITIHKRCVVA